MRSVKITYCLLILSLGIISCNSRKETAQDFAVQDSTMVDSTFTEGEDSTVFAFNPEDEFLGLGLPQFGDLDSMIARRKIRVLVPYSYLYFHINGKQRGGLAFDAMNLFETALNKKLGFHPPKVRVLFIPVNRNQVMPLLREGYADVAYAGMAITEERKKSVDFSKPTITGLKEIIVASLSAPKLHTLADLAGKELYLPEGSSYETSARNLSDSLVQ